MNTKIRSRFAVVSVVAWLSVAATADAGSTVSWVAGSSNPQNALIGGFAPGMALPICRAEHGASGTPGVHPGKVVAGNCNLGYGGKEIVAPTFEVLTINGFSTWVRARSGQAPPNAVVGGQESGRQLLICRAEHSGGLHPGKLVGSNCNIGYGGAELLKREYEVLVTPPY